MVSDRIPVADRPVTKVGVLCELRPGRGGCVELLLSDCPTSVAFTLPLAF